jgi:hypothetical protein
MNFEKKSVINKFLLNGLPKNLLEKKDKDFEVLRLVKLRGFLNRERKREIATNYKAIEIGEPKNFKATVIEKKILAPYLNQNIRFQTFWTYQDWIIKNQQITNKLASLVINVYLMELYDKDWKDYSFDESNFLKVVPEWINIKKNIEKELRYHKIDLKIDPICCSFLQLWFKILQDLKKWESITEETKSLVINAIFAISSAVSSDWFIQEAMNICENISIEFQHLQKNDQIKIENISDMNFNNLLKNLKLIIDSYESGKKSDLEEIKNLAGDIYKYDLAKAESENIEIELNLKIKKLFQLFDEIIIDKSLNLIDKEQFTSFIEMWDLISDKLKKINDLKNQKIDELITIVSTNLDEYKVLCVDYKNLHDSSELISLKMVNEKSHHIKQKLNKDRLLIDEKKIVKEIKKSEIINNLFEVLNLNDPEELKNKEIEKELLDVEYCDSNTISEETLLKKININEVANKEALDNQSQINNESIDEKSEPVQSELNSEQKKIANNNSKNNIIDLKDEKKSIKKIYKDDIKFSHHNNVSDDVVPNLTKEKLAVYDEKIKNFWGLLENNNLSLAYHYACALRSENQSIQIPPLKLLESLVFSSNLLNQNTDIKDKLSVCLESFNLIEKEIGENSKYSSALKLILVSASLRSMLICPEIGASSLLTNISWESSKYTNLYNLIQKFLYSSNLLQGFNIDAAILNTTQVTLSKNTDIRELILEVKNWLNTIASNIIIKYAPAQDVWKNWIRRDGFIYEPLSILINDDSSLLIIVQDFVKQNHDQNLFNKKVKYTDRIDLKRRRGDDIFPIPLEQLKKHSEIAVEFCKRWITLQVKGSSASNKTIEILSDARNFLSNNFNLIKEELDFEYSDDNLGMMRACHKVLLNELINIENWNFNKKINNLNLILTSEILSIPHIHLNNDYSIEEPINFDYLLNQSKPISALIWTDTFYQRLSYGDIFGAELIAENFNPEIDNDTESLIRKEINSWHNKISNLIKNIKGEVEISLAHGILNESEKNSFEAKFSIIESKVNDCLRFDLLNSELNSIRTFCDRKREQEIEIVRKQFNLIDLKSVEVSAKDEVNKAINLGDVTTVREYLSRLESGLSAWPSKEPLFDFHNSFFLDSYSLIGDWLKSNPRANIKEFLLAEKEISFINFTNEFRENIVDVYKAWQDLAKRPKDAERTRLLRILSEIGFQTHGLKLDSNISSNLQIWELNTTIIQNSEICPIPYFGSLSGGRYKLICAWDNLNEDSLFQLVGDPNLISRPSIVFYFGRLSLKNYRDIFIKSKKTRKSLILVDEVMLIYLCMQDSRLSKLFNITLPLSYSFPYDSTAGVVPVEMFYGRTRELDAVSSLNGRCLIYGGRQLGKTALLRRVEKTFHNTEAKRFSKWIDLRAEGIGINREISDIWIVMLHNLKTFKVFENNYELKKSKKNIAENIQHSLVEIINKDPDIRILLLLDEADKFFEEDAKNNFLETNQLKKIMDETGRKFKVVFTGLHNVLRMTDRSNHPLAHFGEPIKIGPFIQEEDILEAENLIRLPFLYSGFDFENDRLLTRILAQTNYYPSLIQLYCSHLLKYMLSKVGTNNNEKSFRYTIRDRDIESVYSSTALREEIRSKFKFTLELDPRYEVIAYSLALNMLDENYQYHDGMNWRNIRQDGAMYWWPEGFKNTSELDFRVLLNEMVDLGVLIALKNKSSFSLRNPNVLLLLGNKDEIESVLIKNREPSVEFESGTFHPLLDGEASSSIKRNPLTYQQLSEIQKKNNSISIIASLPIAGLDDISKSLKVFLGKNSIVTEIHDCTNSVSFIKSLDKAIENRKNDTYNHFIIDSSVPWSASWVMEANKKVKALTSKNKNFSVIFIADPNTLWNFLEEPSDFKKLAIPWISTSPWTDTFVRQWLDDQNLSSDIMIRNELKKITFFWKNNLEKYLSGVNENSILREKLKTKEILPSLTNMSDYGLINIEIITLIETMANYKDAIEPTELVTLLEVNEDRIDHILHYSELLGIVRRYEGNYWIVDDFVKSRIINN